MRYIMHLDMNSFFATVEQQANPFLRGRAIGVSGRPGTRSIVAAASIEAKRQGIKTAMSTAEALAAHPSLRLVVGDNRRYRAVSRQVINIALRFTPDIEVFSIDECFLDLTSAVREQQQHGLLGWQAAANIAVAIKGAIRREVGEYLSCSIGIARNKFLAKLASDTFKPDGLHLITSLPAGSAWQVTVPAIGWQRTHLLIEQVDSFLLATPLIAFCGLGPRLACHLGRLGITTTAELRAADPIWLQRRLGVVGRQLWEYAWGRDERRVALITDLPLPQSFSHAITLPVTDYTPGIARSYLAGLATQVGRRLRQSGMAARRVSCFVRFDVDHQGWGGHVTVTQPIRDGRAILAVATTIFDRYRSFWPIRLVGVGVSEVQLVTELPLPLLAEDVRAERMLSALDLINDRFGEGAAVEAGSLLVKGHQKEATHAFGFHPTYEQIASRY